MNSGLADLEIRELRTHRPIPIPAKRRTRSTTSERERCRHPAKWINFAVTANEFEGKNDDPLVNHKEHNRDFSFATQVIPIEKLSFDFNYSHDDVFSQTDLCYVFVPTATYPLPAGAQRIDWNMSADS